MRSFHDSKKKKAAEAAPAPASSGQADNGADAEEKPLPLSTKPLRREVRDDEDSDTEGRELAKRALKRPAEASRPTAKADDEDDDALLDEEAMVRAIKRAKREEGLKSKSSEYMQLRDELLRSRRAVNVLTGAEAANVSAFLR